MSVIFSLIILISLSDSTIIWRDFLSTDNGWFNNITWIVGNGPALSGTITYLTSDGNACPNGDYCWDLQENVFAYYVHPTINYDNITLTLTVSAKNLETGTTDDSCDIYYSIDSTTDWINIGTWTDNDIFPITKTIILPSDTANNSGIGIKLESQSVTGNKADSCYFSDIIMGGDVINMVHTAYTTIWYDNMDTNNGWNITNADLVRIGWSSISCFDNLCTKTMANNGNGSGIYIATDITNYTSIQLQFDITLLGMESNDECRVYCAYDYRNNTQQIAVYISPTHDVTKEYYEHQIYDLPSSPQSNIVWIVFEIIPGAVSTLLDACLWDNVYLKGIPINNKDTTMDPTESTLDPTLFPTLYPTDSTLFPTLYPTDSTSYPTLYPTKPKLVVLPSLDPTKSAIDSKEVFIDTTQRYIVTHDHDQGKNNMGTSFYIIIALLIVIVMMFICFAVFYWKHEKQSIENEKQIQTAVVDDPCTQGKTDANAVGNETELAIAPGTVNNIKDDIDDDETDDSDSLYDGTKRESNVWTAGGPAETDGGEAEGQETAA